MRYDDEAKTEPVADNEPLNKAFVEAVEDRIYSSALTADQLRNIRSFLDQGADVDTYIPMHETCLILASHAGDTALLALLLAFNPDVSLVDEDGDNALINAIKEHDDALIVKMLITTGVDIFAEGGEIMLNPLTLAIKKNRIAVVEYLLTAVPSYSMQVMGLNTLLQAVILERLEILPLLVRAGANLHEVDSRNGRAVVYAAVEHNKARSLRVLLELGADVNSSSAYGETLLVKAIGLGEDYNKVAETLIFAGADINRARNLDLITPLILAVVNGNEKIVHLLLQRNIEIHARCKNGLNALMYAASKGNVAIVSALLDGGAMLDAVEPTQRSTALMFAAKHGHADIVRLLVVRGADINAKRNDGATALIMAASEGHADVINVLVELGEGNLDLDAMYHGYTALRFTESGGYPNESSSVVLRTVAQSRLT